MPFKNLKSIVFDVNETIFSLKFLENQFELNGLSKNDVKFWFSNVLKEGFSSSINNNFMKFSELGIIELERLFLQKNLKNDIHTLSFLNNSFKNLRSHPEVTESFRILSKKFRLVTLTNGSRNVTRQLLIKNKISDFVELCFSVDEVKKWKPFPAPYIHVCEELKNKPSECLMVAAHGWDVNGAKNIGMRTAYVKRYEKKLNEKYLKPDLIGENLLDITNQIISI